MTCRLAEGPRPRALLLISLLTIVSIGCSTSAESGASTDTPVSEEVAAGASDAGEASVRPGINERFLADDLDVAEITEIFEGESREIFVAREALTDAIGLTPGAAIADVGAGTGLFEPLFSAAVGASGRVYAIDISPAFTRHLKERAAREQLDNVEVVLGGDRSTNLPTDSVDVIFICDTYHHFEYPSAMLADLRSALRPGGQLVIVDFERIPGVTPDWIIEHVRAGKAVFRGEIEAAGFELVEELEVPGIEENYVLRFVSP